MKKFFNDIVTVGYMVNENTGFPIFDIDVEIVDSDDISIFDNKIGSVEYDDGMWLEVYNRDGDVVGYWLDENEI